MALAPVCEEELVRVIQSLNSKKTCDANGISVWLLKRCFRFILSPLTKLINFSFETGTFPSLLKTAKVIPIYKKGDPCQSSNYRPISILPVFSKIFEKVFCERLVCFLENKEILNPEQFGFRKNRSTIDAINSLMDKVVDGLEKGKQVLSVFLDLSKAFDCVHHETLLHQLEKCGVRGLPNTWLASYLKDRDQYVQVSSAKSNKIKVDLGVPQGSNLGPILFLIYVVGLNSVIRDGNLIQYADDTTICFKGKTLQDLEISSFVELNSIIQYFNKLNLKVNHSKSNVVKFCLRPREHAEQPVVYMDDVVVEETGSLKFLGMFIDRGLTWDDHVDSVCSKVTSGIFALRNLGRFCSIEVLRMAYFGLIYPHIAYGIRLWGGCVKNRFERVFRLQKKAVRTMAKLNQRESCRESFRDLGLLTLPCLYILEVVLHCYTRCALVRGRDVHHYETRGRDDYRVHGHRLSVSQHLPHLAGVAMINRLPEDLKNLNNNNQFKTRLKRLLLAGSFYSVEEFMANRWDN